MFVKYWDIHRCERASGYLEVPVEAADVDAPRVPPVVLQCGVVDDVYDGTDDGAGVQGDAVQQGFQPAWHSDNTPSDM